MNDENNGYLLYVDTPRAHAKMCSILFKTIADMHKFCACLEGQLAQMKSDLSGLYLEGQLAVFKKVSQLR